MHADENDGRDFDQNKGDFRPLGPHELQPLHRARPRGNKRYLTFSGDRGFLCCVRRSALRQMAKWGREAGDHEVMGRLVGRHCVDHEGRYVMIEQAVLARTAVCGPVTVFADHDSQADVSRELSEECAAFDSAGWFHTHPQGCGAFYSTTDRESQRTWTDANSIGIVLDPSLPEGGMKVFRGPESVELRAEGHIGQLLETAVDVGASVEREEPGQADSEGTVGADRGLVISITVDRRVLPGWRANRLDALLSISLVSLAFSLTALFVALGWLEARAAEGTFGQEPYSISVGETPDGRAQQVGSTLRHDGSDAHSNPGPVWTWQRHGLR